MRKSGGRTGDEEAGNWRRASKKERPAESIRRSAAFERNLGGSRFGDEFLDLQTGWQRFGGKIQGIRTVGRAIRCGR